MEFTTFKKNSSLVIKITGRMDASNSQLFEKEANSYIDNDNETNIVVDLEELEYISSAGLRSILIAGKKLKSLNGSLKLCNLNGMVEEVFEISGFSAIFETFDSLEEAVE
ncbi:MAG: STAS domain-containing protein [Thermodesulfobacteriota bacterium]